MLILGIESSCDDCAAALVRDGETILSHTIHSQFEIHKPYGGVVPELASRNHLEKIIPVIETAMEDAGAGWADLDGIAATYGPGLVGSLLVGLSAAKALAFALDIPFRGVNHLEGHLMAIFLEDATVSFPFLGLIVSGGHTSLYRVEGFGAYRLLGQTRDDAAGEAFDKVAKLLGLGYPGGIAIDRLSEGGNPQAFSFPRAMTSPKTLDFSFSGLKTAVRYFVRATRTLVHPDPFGGPGRLFSRGRGRQPDHQALTGRLLHRGSKRRCLRGGGLESPTSKPR